MSKILIGKLLGSTGKCVLNYKDMVPLWVMNRIGSIRMLRVLAKIMNRYLRKAKKSRPSVPELGTA
jgi:hypothetical protein